MTVPRGAYDGSAAAWAQGPARFFDSLARRVVEPFSARLRGETVLDAGAGTGAACRALQYAGATAVACDASADMLGHVGDAALLCVVGDLCALPFIDSVFGAAVSAFAISHVDAPQTALAEMRRVVRPGGLVIVAVFGAAAASASKDVIHEVAARRGWTPPAWYVHLKTRTEPLTNTGELLHACAQAAGLGEIVVDDIVVDSGLTSPEEIVEYRTGMAHLAPFVSSLSPDQRDGLLREAVRAIRERGQPVSLRVLIMSSRARA